MKQLKIDEVITFSPRRKTNLDVQEDNRQRTLEVATRKLQLGLEIDRV